MDENISKRIPEFKARELQDTWNQINAEHQDEKRRLKSEYESNHDNLSEKD